jgi:hypothetical protein
MELCEAGCGHLALDYGEWRVVATEREPGTDEMVPRILCHECSVDLLTPLTKEGRRVRIDVRIDPTHVSYMIERLRRTTDVS